MVYSAYLIVTDKDPIKARPLFKKLAKGFMVSVVIGFTIIILPNYITDLYKLDISQVTGKVDENRVFPPAMFFISQTIKLEGRKHQKESYRLGLSGSIIRPNHIYRIKYLKRSRQIITIEELAPGQ